MNFHVVHPRVQYAAERNAFAHLPVTYGAFLSDIMGPLSAHASFATTATSHLVPTLRLRIELHHANRQLDYADTPAKLLRAFAQLADCARCIGTAPQQHRTTFWLLVHRSLKPTGASYKYANRSNPEIDVRLLEKAGYPQFCVEIEQTHWQPLSDGTVDVLVEILTSSRALFATESVSYTAKPASLLESVNLRFKYCELSANCLRLLQRSLDHVASLALSLRTRLNLLALDSHTLTHEHFTVLAGMMLKNHDVYGIRELDLEQTLTNATKAADAFEALLQAIFRSPVATQPIAKEKKKSKGLRRVTLRHNPLSVRHFAVICSALRYGCVIEELSLAETMHDNDLTTAERQECWRWLAFGLFYPRSGNLRTRAAPLQFLLRKLDLSGLIRNETDMDAFAEALAHPLMIALASQENHELQFLSSFSQLSICSLKPGSTIRQVADSQAAVILTLDGGSEDNGGSDAHEFEALCATQCGWIGVVVPAFGLGWVPATQISETVVASTGHLFPSRPYYDLSVSSVAVDIDTTTTEASLKPFIDSVGPQLTSLNLSHKRFTSHDLSTLTTISTRCVNLQKLVLDNCKFDALATYELVTLLQNDTPLTRHLKCLSLNGAKFEAQDFNMTERVCLMLGDCTKLPNLTKLHFNVSACTQHAISVLYRVLPARTRLTLLELQVPKMASACPSSSLTFSPTDFVAFVSPRLFDWKCHNELVHLRLSARKKAAFLSVVLNQQDESSRRVRAFAALDVVLLRIILEFLSRGYQYRQLVWRSRMPRSQQSGIW